MGWPTDTLAGVYLCLFAFGALFSTASLLLGTLGGHSHLPAATHAGHAGHFGHHSHGGAAADHAGAEASGPGAAPGPLNLATLMIFLTWFGAVGYLSRAYAGEIAALSLLFATLAGLIGAAIVWAFLAKILWRGQTQLDPNAYAVVGVAARVTSPIALGGTGEIVYTLDGKQCVDGARAVEGAPIPRGADVAILRREGGLAYVVPMDDDTTAAPFPALDARAEADTPPWREGEPR